MPVTAEKSRLGGDAKMTAGASAEDPKPRAASADAGASAFAHLLKLEADARHASSIRELDALCANECRILLRARQAVIIERREKRTVVRALSGVATVDRSVPLVQWLEEIGSQVAAATHLEKLLDFDLPAYAPADDPLTSGYPFRAVLCVPLWLPRGKNVAALLLMRETPWLEADRKIATRLAETFGHARALLSLSGRSRSAFSLKGRYAALAAIVLAMVLALPVPITVLAPLEVVPREADVVAMPMDGIVSKVLVAPNAAVAAGTPLVQLVDTTHRAKAEVTAKEVAVAAAKVEQATSLAFNDMRGRQDLGLARAELALKMAEHSYAKTIAEQALIKAERPGTAVFSDPREFEGRPLSVGERLMLIARENLSELRIALPVSDSIVLRPGLRVKAHLDADPLNPIEATIATVDFQARLDETQTAIYPVVARPVSDGGTVPLGSRGTAQIFGERAPLFIYLFRRPITAIRQRIGL